MDLVKAQKAKMFIGDIELDVFLLESGEYKYSKTQIETSLGYEPTRRAYRDFLTSKDPKAIQAKGLAAGNYKIKYEGKTYTLVSQEEVVLFWGFQAQNGNQSAQYLLMACALEALERRADAAFGKERSEEERNKRIEARTKGKIARRNLTDAIKDYIENHEVSENYRKNIFSNCSNHLNKIILGAKAKQAKEFYQIPESSLLRNHIPVEALRELELTEEMASRLIDEREVEPLEAVKQACVLCFTKSIGMV